jgi:hypothetical protein
MYEIYGVFNFAWLLKAVLFLIASVVSFYLPGIVLSHWAGITDQKKHLLAWMIGIGFWGIQGYAFGWLQVRWATYLYLGFFVWQAWKMRKHWWPIGYKLGSTSLQKVILVIGTILFLIPVIGSGWRTTEGIAYYWINAYDGLYHLSLSRSLVESVPPIEPGAYDLVVQNYHYLSNLIIADFGRVWRLPINHLYFQFFPVLLAVLLGLTVGQLLKTWSGQKTTVTLGLLLFYLAGEISWLLTWILNSGTELPFNNYIDSGIIQFLNPPQAFAKLLFFVSLILLRDFWQKKSWKLAVILGVIIASMLALKIYFALFLGLGLACVYTVELSKVLILVVKKKLSIKQSWREYRWDLVLGLTILAIGTALYLPSNSQAGGIYFDFLFWPRLLLGQGKIFWNEWWLRLQVYEAAQNTRALLVWYSLAIGIFLSAIYHFRLVGLLVVFKRFRSKMLSKEVILLVVPSIVLTHIAMNYVQISGGGNIFNFFVVAITSLSLLSTIVLGELWQKIPKLRFLIVICIGMMAIQPLYNTYAYLKNYYYRRDKIVITAQHEALMKYLSANSKSKDSEKSYLQTSPGALLDENTPYWYFFTGKLSYFGGRQILQDHNQDVSAKKLVEQFIFRDPATASDSARIAYSAHIGQIVLQRSQKSTDAFLFRAKLATFSGTFIWQQEYENEEWLVLRPVPMD